MKRKNNPAAALKRSVLYILAALAAAPAVQAAQAADMPWMDQSLTADKRAALVLAQMSQEEKLTLVFGYFGNDFGDKKKNPAALPLSAGYIPGIERLGIPALYETDAGIGVASQPSAKAARERTALPAGLAVAASWNRQIAYAGGAMIGSEARASGFNVMLAGGANLARDPRNGRNFEYAGEDPLLAGTMVGEEIKGVQSNHVISTVKHFAINDQETGRTEADAHIDRAAARMSDLLAMQLAIERADPGAVMCAYNRVNGEYSCENDYLLNGVLKKDWAYPGFVMSDWGAAHSTVAAANHGLDQESAWEFDKAPYFSGALEDAVHTGSVAQARLDDMARRILRTMFDKGVVDHPVAPDGAIDFPAHAIVSREAAEEGMVLLKNAGRVLPLRKDLKTIAVIGAHADVGVLSGGGSSQVYPVGGNAVPGLEPHSWPGPVVYDPSSPLRAIQALVPGAQVQYDEGDDAAKAAQLAAKADVVLVFARQWIGEGNDAASLALPDGQDALIAKVAAANPRTVVVLENGGPVAMPWLDQTAAVLEAWYPGSSGGEAIARILFGEINPSGHLPLSFPVSADQLPRKAVDGDPAQPKQQFTIDYHEGAAVGYKWFDLQGTHPLFPFGHGLSYTDFSYSNAAVEQKDGRLSVTFTVTNTGNRAGKAVPQVYAAPLAGTKWEAPKRLVAWDKIELRPGESKTATVQLDPRLLAMFDEKSKTWRIAAGRIKFMVAHDAADRNSVDAVAVVKKSSLDPAGKPVSGRAD
ncbi:MAG TPA: glycoside hydrolase family 3 C-terminal domain-containing protein [Burkholderiaceae bacterium]